MRIPLNPDPKKAKVAEENMTRFFDGMFEGSGYVVLAFDPTDTTGVILMSNVAHAKIIEVMDQLKKEIERVHHSH